jgi:arylsulfatase A-like enzyme
MCFTDAHAGTSVCTPSRYNILTGRYCWRSRLKCGIVWEWDGSLIESDRKTVADILKEEGYRTACIGKWHLGWDWPTIDGSSPNEELPFGKNDAGIAEQRHAFGEKIDYTGRLGGGPVDHGFDSYFGVDVPNFPPYTWFEDDHLTSVPSTEKPSDMYGNPGKAVPGWDLERMIPEFTLRAVNFIESNAGPPGQQNAPFFLYFPLTSPHSPIIPNRQFQGKSGCGPYGDFVCEVDWVVGEVMDALERSGARENTLLIFTSDNGPEVRTSDGIGAYERIRQYDHYSMGTFRGVKRDAWEGGHRVPFIASWPKVISPESRCDQMVCLGDFMATCTDILSVSLGPETAEDSISMLPLLQGNTGRPTRRSVVHHSMTGKFALRTKNWVYIDAPSGGDNEEPDWFRKERGYEPHNQPAELFSLDSDLPECNNLYSERPDIVKEMSTELERIKSGDDCRSVEHSEEYLTE